MSRSVRGTSSQRSVSKQSQRQQRVGDYAASAEQTKKIDDFIANTERMVKELQEGLAAFKSDIPTIKANLRARQESVDNTNVVINQLGEKNTSLEADNNKLLREKQKLEETNAQLQIEITEKDEKIKAMNLDLEQTRFELASTTTRLSEVMGNKLTDNNPAIADLSDTNRPTKLAEKSSEIYDNEWTDAFEAVQNLKQSGEQECVSILLRILKMANRFCMERWQNYVSDYQQAISRGKTKHLPDYLNKQLKDVARVLASDMPGEIFKELIGEKISNMKEENRILFEAREIKSYLKACVELCWLMAAQDPPVVFKVEFEEGNKFDINIFKAFTKNGGCIDYVVWPPLFLYDGGELLSKGVAQGFGDLRPVSAPAKVNSKPKDRFKRGLISTLKTNPKQAWTEIKPETQNPKIAGNTTGQNVQKNSADSYYEDSQQRNGTDKERKSSAELHFDKNPTENVEEMETASSFTNRSSPVSDTISQQPKVLLESFRSKLQKDREPHELLPDLPTYPTIQWKHARTPTQEEIDNFRYFVDERYTEQEMKNRMGSGVVQMCNDYYKYCKQLLSIS